MCGLIPVRDVRARIVRIWIILTMFQLRHKNITHIAYSCHKEIIRKATFECKLNVDEKLNSRSNTSRSNTGTSKINKHNWDHRRSWSHLTRSHEQLVLQWVNPESSPRRHTQNVQTPRFERQHFGSNPEIERVRLSLRIRCTRSYPYLGYFHSTKNTISFK